MWKALVAGLMCVGTVSIGVALTRGQDSEAQPAKGDVAPAVAEEQLAELQAAVQEAAGKLVEIQIGTEEGLAAPEVAAGAALDDQEIVVIDEGGRTVERRRGPVNLRLSRRVGGPQVLDQATREAVEKMIAGLKDDAKRLAGEGKPEESERKAQSAEALGRLLAGAGEIANVRRIDVRAIHENAPVVAKLHGAAKHLSDRIAELKRDGRLDEASKLEQELAEIKQKVGELHNRMFFIAHPGGLQAPGAPVLGAAGDVVYGPAGAFGGVHPHVWDRFPGQRPGVVVFGSPEAEALAHKAEALSQAAAKLKEAGLDDQAQAIAKQAEEAKARAEAIRRSTARVVEGPAGFPGGPQAGELQRSIRELQDQVQLLRKEVAELRELIQRRP